MKARFNYPPEFVTLPDYTAHAGQEVEVLRPLRDGDTAEGPSEYDGPSAGLGTGMYRIRAADGWEGAADREELDPMPPEVRP